MKYLTLKNIAAAVGGKYHGPSENLEKQITMTALDSRLIQKDGLFFATKGEKTNGHRFLPSVFEKGALCAITERELTFEDMPEGTDVEKVSYIVVSDSFAALRKLAAWYRKQLDIKVVGITGSVGKTSTKEMIAAVLSAKYRVLKTEGNFNNSVGLPLTIMRLTDEDEIAVLEMGISDFGEMSTLASIARPDVCVITNIGQCHLENLGDRDGIFLAKTEMFHYLREGGSAVLNGSDDKLIRTEQVCKKEPLFFNDGKTSYATDIESMGLLGSRCIIHSGDMKIDVTIPVPGSHQITNALAAAKVAAVFGLTAEQIKEGIKRTGTISGRSNIIKTDRYVIIDDCYNANPASMRAGLMLLSEADTRKVAVLGDMFELGADEKALHRQIGQAMEDKEYRPDVLICIGELAKNIYEGSPDTVDKHIYPDKESFISDMDSILKDGDTILLKASHGMEFVKLLDALK
ncbi:MAG: UDP-N-acetylmuramoyl-tripeptide--D-alanyl-D-alanine ligase [Lachnospiraceae bacterium]|nr:UDP-N-acetylmuramoyl-tripeptide--D-alanyl-D-alanine ligase [Lachnospiraceae bacterium]